MSGAKRPYLDSVMVSHLVLHSLFPMSPIKIISPAEFNDEWPLIVSGPKFQLDFLDLHFWEMFNKSPRSLEGGSWVGLHRKDGNEIRFFYRQGSQLLDRLKLVMNRFRREVVLYGNLKISELSVLEIMHQDLKVPHRINITFPEGISNGRITIPPII